MTTQTADLWPADIAGPPAVQPPVAILRQQAGLLGQKTGNAVYASVDSYVAGGELIHVFHVNVSYLSYRAEFFRVLHAVTQSYPLRFEGRMVSESLQKKRANDQDEFAEMLRQVLASPQCVEAIRTLVAQVSSVPV